MENFDNLGLPETLLASLKSMQFSKPTQIQAETIPVALSGSDVIGSSRTGSGKTIAYGIPLVARLLRDTTCKALVMAPTRELAAQILTALQQLIGSKGNIKSALLIGGDSMYKQLNQLRGNPRLIVGTPGRINDHLKRASVSLKEVRFLVLDETDRMLDMGFGIQIERIAKFLPTERQTLMFSATLPNNIVKLSQSYLKNPVRISVGSTVTPAANVKQENIKLPEIDKYKTIVTHLDQHEGTFIIFVNTKRGTDKLATRLIQDGHNADCIHGDLRQGTREKIIRMYREGKRRILVATDVAARGLDIPHIEFVINHDLPQCSEDYIHRIGRTGRADAQGTAINLISPQDGAKWRAIQKLMDPGSKPDADHVETGNDRNKRNGRGNRRPDRFGGRNSGGRGGFRSRDNDGGPSGFGRREKSDFDADFATYEGGRSRPARNGVFKPGREGGLVSRDDRGSRSEGGFKPRREGSFGSRDDRGSRSEGGFKSRREGSFGSRDDRGSRSEGGFKPRREGSFGSRDNRGPRTEGEYKPRREGGFKDGEGRGKRPVGAGKPSFSANGRKKAGTEGRSTLRVKRFA